MDTLTIITIVALTAFTAGLAAPTTARATAARRVTLTCLDCGHTTTTRLRSPHDFWTWGRLTSSAHVLASPTCSAFDAHVPTTWGPTVHELGQHIR